VGISGILWPVAVATIALALHWNQHSLDCCNAPSASESGHQGTAKHVRSGGSFSHKRPPDQAASPIPRAPALHHEGRLWLVRSGDWPTALPSPSFAQAGGVAWRRNGLAATLCGGRTFVKFDSCEAISERAVGGFLSFYPSCISDCWSPCVSTSTSRLERALMRWRVQWGPVLAQQRSRSWSRRSPGGGTASTTRRDTARRWRACCPVSSAARPGIVVVCSCRGGYSCQQCHGKFRPVRARRLALKSMKARSPPTDASWCPRRAARPPFSKIAALYDDRGMTTRRPAPWRADKMPGGYVVHDAKGQVPV